MPPSSPCPGGCNPLECPSRCRAEDDAAVAEGGGGPSDHGGSRRCHPPAPPAREQRVPGRPVLQRQARRAGLPAARPARLFGRLLTGPRPVGHRPGGAGGARRAGLPSFGGRPRRRAAAGGTRPLRAAVHLDRSRHMGPVLLVGAGSGLVPLMFMVRCCRCSAVIASTVRPSSWRALAAW